MEIGILGCGKVGTALGCWAAARDYNVKFASRQFEDAERAAQKAGPLGQAVPVEALFDQCKFVLLTMPYDKIESALQPHQQRLQDKILVDVSNPITADHRELVIGHTASGAETLAHKFPMAHFIKAFNATFAEVYAAQHSRISGEQLSVCFAGDNTLAKDLVKSLIDRLGFDPVDAGPLRNARYLEPLSLLNIQLGRALGYGTDIGFSLVRKNRSQ